MTPAPLDERIVGALTGAATSREVEAVLVDARKAHKDIAILADGADVDSLNPLATNAEALILRQRGTDLRFEADRLDASVSALEAHAADLKDQEAAALAAKIRAAVIVTRDKLAADIKRDYPRIVAELTALVKRSTESDKACAQVGITETAEAVGRGVGYATKYGPVHRLADITLQMADGGPAWTKNSMSGAITWRALNDVAD